MQTDRAHTHRGSRLARLGWVGIVLAAVTGCSRGWDAYDPNGAGGSSGDGGGGANARCGGVDALADDFDDGTVSDAWWADQGDGATLAEQDGQLVLTLPESGWTSAALSSRFSYDFIGRAVSVEAVKVPSESHGAQAVLEVGTRYQDTIRTYFQGDQLVFAVDVDGAAQDLASVLYDSAEHRRWRIREQSGTVYWETSGGESWVEQAQLPAAQLFDLRHVGFGVSADGSGDGATVETRFDDLGGGGPPLAPLCGTHTLTDDFADGERGAAWSRHSYDSPSCRLVETGGELVASMDSGDWRSCAYGSANLYDFRGSSVAWEITSPPGEESGAGVALQVVKEYGHSSLSIALGGGELHCDEKQGDATSTIAFRQYNQAEHRWLRLREEAGAVHCETSADGRDWSEMGQSPTPFDVSVVQIYLDFFRAADPPATAELRVDNLNLVP